MDSLYWLFVLHKLHQVFLSLTSASVSNLYLMRSVSLSSQDGTVPFNHALQRRLLPTGRCTDKETHKQPPKNVRRTDWIQQQQTTIGMRWRQTQKSCIQWQDHWHAVLAGTTCFVKLTDKCSYTEIQERYDSKLPCSRQWKIPQVACCKRQKCHPDRCLNIVTTNTLSVIW